MKSPQRYEVTVDPASRVDFRWHGLFDSADLKILDDDVAELVVTPLLWAVTADGNFSFTVKLSTEPTHSVTVRVALQNESAVGGDVYVRVAVVSCASVRGCQAAPVLEIVVHLACSFVPFC